VHSGQKTHAPRSIVNGFRETACVGHTSTQAEQPSVQTRRVKLRSTAKSFRHRCSGYVANHRLPFSQAHRCRVVGLQFHMQFIRREKSAANRQGLEGDLRSHAAICAFFACKRLPWVRFSSRAFFLSRYGPMRFYAGPLILLQLNR